MNGMHAIVIDLERFPKATALVIVQGEWTDVAMADLMRRLGMEPPQEPPDKVDGIDLAVALRKMRERMSGGVRTLPAVEHRPVLPGRIPKPDDRSSEAQVDGHVRAIWEVALRWVVERMHPAGVETHWDDVRVTDLRDLLLNVYEQGAERSTAQFRAMDVAHADFVATMPLAPMVVQVRAQDMEQLVKRHVARLTRELGQDWRHKSVRPEEHGQQAVLALHTGGTGAGMDEAWRLAWWDAKRGLWQGIDCESWVADDRFPPDDPWLLSWLPLDRKAAESTESDAG